MKWLIGYWLTSSVLLVDVGSCTQQISEMVGPNVTTPGSTGPGPNTSQILRQPEAKSLIPDWMVPIETLETSQLLKLPKKPKKKKFTLCNSLKAPCLCDDANCCGTLSGNVYFNCAWNAFQGAGGVVTVTVNPCSKTVCTEGHCKIVALLSKTGELLSRRGECCSGGQFSQVMCGNGIECQQDNNNGSYTVCCSPSCSKFF